MNIQNYGYNQLLSTVDLVSTINISGLYNNGPSNTGVEAFLRIPLSTFSIDLVEVKKGHSVLLSNQDNRNENGIYICIQTGGIYNFSILQRRPDFHSIEQLRSGQFFSISDGAINKGALYSLVTPLPITLGIDPIHIISSSPSFKRSEFDAVDFGSLDNIIVLPGMVELTAFNGTSLTFNNPINVSGDPISSQIVGNVFIVNTAGTIQGAMVCTASGLNVDGVLEENSLSIVNANSIDLSGAELDKGTVFGNLVTISPIAIPTNILGLSPRAVINNSGLSIHTVDAISGAFDYLMIANDAANYYVSAGTSVGQAGDVTKCNAQYVLKLNINGNDRFIPLFETN